MSERINNKLTENNDDNSAIKRLEALKPAFNAVGVALKVSKYPAQGYEPLDFKFDHFVIKAIARAEFDYDLLKELDFIDITYVTDYPEGCLAFIDASKKLPNEFFYYLVNRARTLLTIVNMNYNKYDEIEDCAAYRDLMTTLVFIHKYSDKFDHYNNTMFILIRRYDVPGVYLDIVNAYDTPDIAAPKPIPILDNPRYKDYGKHALANGVFVTDPNIKSEKVKDFDTAALYPIKKNPVNFNPVELLRKLALDNAEHDFYKKQWDLFEKTNKETVKRTIKKKKTDFTIPIEFSFDQLTDEQIADNYEEILKYYVIRFNELIDYGMPIEKVWEKTDIGKNLIGFINYIFDLSTKDKFGKYINFSLTVDDNYKLQLGKYSDVNPTSANFGLMKPGNFIRKYHADEDAKDDETDSDDQQQ